MDVSGLSDRARFSARCELVLNTFFLISLEIGSSRGSSDWGSFASGPRQRETWPESSSICIGSALLMLVFLEWVLRDLASLMPLSLRKLTRTGESRFICRESAKRTGEKIRFFERHAIRAWLVIFPSFESVSLFSFREMRFHVSHATRIFTTQRAFFSRRKKDASRFVIRGLSLQYV